MRSITRECKKNRTLLFTYFKFHYMVFRIHPRCGGEERREKCYLYNLLVQFICQIKHYKTRKPLTSKPTITHKRRRKAGLPVWRLWSERYSRPSQ